MEQLPPVLPVLPIRNAVLFSGVSMPLVVGRPRSIQAVQQAAENNNLLLVVTQKVSTAGDPEPEDLYRVGTLCRMESFSYADAGSRQIIVTGLSRYRIAEFEERGPILIARGETVADTHSPDPIRNQALLHTLKTVAKEILELLPGASEPMSNLVDRVEDPAYLANICAAYLNLSLTQKQEILETVEIEGRIDRLLTHMRKEREVLYLQREIRDKMSERLNKAQREALLREQIRTIRSELGDEAAEDAADELEDKLRDAGLPPEADRQARDELKRLRSLPPAAAEYHVIRSYLEMMASLPWSRSTQDQINLKTARLILDEDHFGLEQVKKRILQFLAVAKLKNDLRGPILCLVGPPGVGKTSLGQSIARTLGRKFIRASLGGVRDEAEIRGHRRTYVGAMPGRIIQSLKRVGTRNPVMMLDEIDKLRTDFQGDPSAALLEVLDPEQNNRFVDHYLDVPFDLSDVFFIATANQLDTIPGPLRDRMEVIELHGYTPLEKLEIGRRHLVPRELQANGLQASQALLPDTTLDAIIHSYTREAGVRELQRQIGAVFRHVAEKIVEAPEAAPLQVDLERLQEFLGAERYIPEIRERRPRPGISTGLAWTPHGGDILYIEATRMASGKGSLILTGQLGDVMKESAQIALSLARSIPQVSLPGFEFGEHDLHIHVPAGAIPKDGPSAGTAIFGAIASLLLGRSIPLEIALTGELTLRGAVLPVGGIKEKVLAAHRAEVRTVILPKRNEKDLRNVPDQVRNEVRFVFVDTVDDLMALLFPKAAGLNAADEQQPTLAA